MARRIPLFKQPKTPEELKRNDRVGVLILAVALVFLIHNLYLSMTKDISRVGVLGYFTGPIFTHKMSEFLLVATWMPVVWVYNYEKLGIYPDKMPRERYFKLLQWLLVLAPIQIVLATYAWTVVNLGASPLTTDFKPLSLGEEGAVWKYYLGALIFAGAAFVVYASRALIRLAKRKEE